MTEQEAKNKAKELAKRLGRGWKPQYWHNLGWHYAVVLSLGGNKTVRVSEYDGKFSAMVGTDGCGDMSWSNHHNRFLTPDAAVEAEINRCRGYVTEWTRALEVFDTVNARRASDKNK